MLFDLVGFDDPFCPGACGRFIFFSIASRPAVKLAESLYFSVFHSEIKVICFNSAPIADYFLRGRIAERDRDRVVANLGIPRLYRFRFDVALHRESYLRLALDLVDADVKIDALRVVDRVAHQNEILFRAGVKLFHYSLLHITFQKSTVQRKSEE